MFVFRTYSVSDATVTHVRKGNRLVYNTWGVQFRDGNKLPNAEGSISIRVPHRVDDIFVHHQQ